MMNERDWDVIIDDITKHGTGFSKLGKRVDPKDIYFVWKLTLWQRVKNWFNTLFLRRWTYSQTHAEPELSPIIMGIDLAQDEPSLCMRRLDGTPRDQ